MEGDRVTYKIWLEVEKHTEGPDELDSDKYEDVTREFNWYSAAFESTDPDKVKAAIEALQLSGERLES